MENIRLVSKNTQENNIYNHIKEGTCVNPEPEYFLQNRLSTLYTFRYTYFLGKFKNTQENKNAAEADIWQRMQ